MIAGFSSFSLPLCSFLQFCFHFLLFHSAIPVVMLFDTSLLGLFGLAAYSFLNDSVWLLGLLLHYLKAPMSHIFPLGHPWSICFSWASLAFFLTLHSHGPLLTPLGLPGSISLSFSFGAHGLAINPLLSLLALIQAYCGPFSLFYITYCPWFFYFSPSGLL